tara:strand:- start:14186 stop:14515 length:330 start_codon:yes stop_codon:yes gene_type:complete
MLRRYFNEDDFQDEYFDGQEPEEEAEFIQYIGKDELISSIEDMEMFELNFNGKILKMAIKICRDNWLWKFRRATKKVEIVKKVYNLLNAILVPADSEDENEGLEDLDEE